MKLELYVIVRKGMFLGRYENREGVLLPSSDYCDTITQALAYPKRAMTPMKFDILSKLAAALDAQLAIATMDVEVRDLVGEPLTMNLEVLMGSHEDIETNDEEDDSDELTEEQIKEALCAFFDTLAN